ncbi:hypothetical protein SDC9_203720 [bioreactor metagenome]|uniref:Uncharacterized protein n=1 Tax=bioreactor metagenome TaxID=1076179 RepID=A0A645IX80_9ZZZZ
MLVFTVGFDCYLERISVLLGGYSGVRMVDQIVPGRIGAILPDILQYQAIRQRQILSAAQGKNRTAVSGKNPRENIELHKPSLISGKYSIAAVKKQDQPHSEYVTAVDI